MGAWKLGNDSILLHTMSQQGPLALPPKSDRSTVGKDVDKAIRCTRPSCACECFQPGRASLRTCERCRHGWVTHALDKLSTQHLFGPVQVELVQPSVVFDISSLMLYGTQALPVRLKILLDRLYSVLTQEEVLHILHGLGWTLRDYVRGYMLQDAMGKVLDRWSIMSQEEEMVTLQQFLRFGETKPIVELMALQEQAGQEVAVTLKDTESGIRTFIESSSPAPSPALLAHLQGRGTNSIHHFENLPNSLAFVLPFQYINSGSAPFLGHPANGLVREPGLAGNGGSREPVLTNQNDSAEVQGSEASLSPCPSLVSPTGKLNPKMEPRGTPSPSPTPPLCPSGHHGQPHPKIGLRSLSVHPSLSCRQHRMRRLGVGSRKGRVCCASCGKTFYDKGTLKIHVNAVHLKIKHRCTVQGCNMVFSSLRSRNRHSANPNPRLHLPVLRNNRDRDLIRATANQGIAISAGRTRLDMPVMSGLAHIETPILTGRTHQRTTILSSRAHPATSIMTSHSHLETPIMAGQALPYTSIVTGHAHSVMPNSTSSAHSTASIISSVPVISVHAHLTPPIIPGHAHMTPPQLTPRPTSGLDPLLQGSLVLPPPNPIPPFYRTLVPPAATLIQSTHVSRPSPTQSDQLAPSPSHSPHLPSQDPAFDSAPKKKSRKSSMPVKIEKESVSSIGEDEEDREVDPCRVTESSTNIRSISGTSQDGCQHSPSPGEGSPSPGPLMWSEENRGKCSIESGHQGGAERRQEASNTSTSERVWSSVSNQREEEEVGEREVLKKAPEDVKEERVERNVHSSPPPRQPILTLTDELRDPGFDVVYTGWRGPHPSLSPRTCHVCRKSFRSSYSMKLHHRNVHLKEMHVCTLTGCSAAFPSRRSRDRHSSNMNLHRKLLTKELDKAVSDLQHTSQPLICGGRECGLVAFRGPEDPCGQDVKLPPINGCSLHYPESHAATEHSTVSSVWSNQSTPSSTTSDPGSIEVSSLDNTGSNACRDCGRVAVDWQPSDSSPVCQDSASSACNSPPLSHDSSPGPETPPPSLQFCSEPPGAAVREICVKSITTEPTLRESPQITTMPRCGTELHCHARFPAMRGQTGDGQNTRLHKKAQIAAIMD